MRIARLELHNWLCFRGRQALDLEPMVYGVTARWERDPDRSNWGGKTSLLSSIRFVLYGQHGADTEDEWITRGEPEGGVVLTLDTGERVERTRQRGKATRLRLTASDLELHGDEAQRAIVDRVGLADPDFANVCFFEQKRFARFVTATSGDRLRIVRSWLGLDALYGARDRVGQQLRGALKDQQAADAELAAEQRRELDALSEVGIQVSARATLGAALREADARVGAATDRLAKLERTAAEAAARRRDAADLERWEEITRELAIAPEGQGVMSGPDTTKLQRRYDEALQKASEARRVAGQARQVAQGEFDGGCPVLRGFCCPATQEINGSRGEARKAASEAAAAYDVVSRELAARERDMDEAQRAERERQQRAGRVRALQAEQQRLEPAAERARRWRGVAEQDPGDEIVDARAALQAANRDVLVRERIATELAGVDRRRAAAEGKRRQARAAVMANQEALAVLAVARRTIADEALSSIAARANQLLSEAGVDLSLEVSWMREVRGQLATACDACGSPFPASQRVKECGCGAERGPKQSEELELRVSARSGAADDLAGLVFCLAAGAWLRERRSSGWGVCFLDEPAGALDVAHKRLLAAHVGAMLSTRHGFSQAFVVAHEQGFTDGLPGSIVIRATAAGSTVEVVR